MAGALIEGGAPSMGIWRQLSLRVVWEDEQPSIRLGIEGGGRPLMGVLVGRQPPGRLIGGGHLLGGTLMGGRCRARTVSEFFSL